MSECTTKLLLMHIKHFLAFTSEGVLTVLVKVTNIQKVLDCLQRWFEKHCKGQIKRRNNEEWLRKNKD